MNFGACLSIHAWCAAARVLKFLCLAFFGIAPDVGVDDNIVSDIAGLSQQTVDIVVKLTNITGFRIGPKKTIHGIGATLLGAGLLDGRRHARRDFTPRQNSRHRP